MPRSQNPSPETGMAVGGREHQHPLLPPHQSTTPFFCATCHMHNLIPGSSSNPCTSPSFFGLIKLRATCKYLFSWICSLQGVKLQMFLKSFLPLLVPLSQQLPLLSLLTHSGRQQSPVVGPVPTLLFSIPQPLGCKLGIVSSTHATGFGEAQKFTLINH